MRGVLHHRNKITIKKDSYVKSLDQNKIFDNKITKANDCGILGTKIRFILAPLLMLSLNDFLLH